MSENLDIFKPKPTIQKIICSVDNSKKRPKYFINFVVTGVLFTYSFCIQTNKKNYYVLKKNFEGWNFL